MKTAEQIAGELEIALDIAADNDDRQTIINALKEYSEAVRQKAAGVCRIEASPGNAPMWVSAAEANAAAIERMELP